MLTTSVAGAHERDRQPGAADGLQRIRLQVGAERDAEHGLRGHERPARELDLARSAATAPRSSPTSSAANSVADESPTRSSANATTAVRAPSTSNDAAVRIAPKR